MSYLSIRSLPQDIERALKAEAKQCGKSKSQIVIEALAEKFGLHSKAQKKKRLRAFSGKLSQEDFESLQKAVEDFETIDPSLWK
ncbi:MAG: hypothetical protein IPJ69_08985 [Deltaproteobacteria bacterium]|nr:MAG: hypothetical protein IPJ69_08985 [Deltaproteobacteria bacterium]